MPENPIGSNEFVEKAQAEPRIGATAELDAVRTVEPDPDKPEGASSLSASLNATGNEVEAIEHPILGDQSAGGTGLVEQTAVTPKAQEAEADSPKLTLDAVVTQDTTPLVEHSEVTADVTPELEVSKDDDQNFFPPNSL